MEKITTMLLIILSLDCSGIEAKDNPFMKMVGKQYTDYSTSL